MTLTASNSASSAPVITIDGPTASGKGTVAHRVAKALGWAVLDSGALYRLTALAAINRGIAAEDEPAVARVAETLDVRFEGPHVYLEGVDAGHDIRREEVGNFASRVAACIARSSPSATPVPMMARPMPDMIVLTSAKSRLMSPGTRIKSEMPWMA